MSLVFLGQAFTIMLVYVWSRRNPNVRMNFFGLLNFQAPFLPWVLMGFSLLLGNSIIVDLLGSYLLRPSTVTQQHECAQCPCFNDLFIYLNFLEASLLAMCTSFWRMCSPTSQVVEGGWRPHLLCKSLVSSYIVWIKTRMLSTHYSLKA